MNYIDSPPLKLAPYLFPESVGAANGPEFDETVDEEGCDENRQLFGSVRIKDENGGDVCYRRIGRGIWLSMDAERYVWTDSVEVPEPVPERAEEFDEFNSKEWAVLIC